LSSCPSISLSVAIAQPLSLRHCVKRVLRDPSSHWRQDVYGLRTLIYSTVFTPSYLQLSHKRINSGLYDIIIQQNRINVCLFHVAYSNTINLSCFLFFFVCFVFISLYMCISVFYCVIIIFVSNHTCIDHVHLLHVL